MRDKSFYRMSWQTEMKKQRIERMLKVLERERNFTISELAERFQLSGNYISKILKERNIKLESSREGSIFTTEQTKRIKKSVADHEVRIIETEGRKLVIICHIGKLLKSSERLLWRSRPFSRNIARKKRNRVLKLMQQHDWDLKMIDI